MLSLPLYAVVPAAGIGSRMESEIPKQYLKLGNKTIIEHTLGVLLTYPSIEKVIVAIHPNDQFFEHLSVFKHPKIEVVIGGDERVNSVLSALEWLASKGEDINVMVHDAARPCLTHADIDKLISQSRGFDGGILASSVRDTMKRGTQQGLIDTTVEREQLYHALTPQLFNLQQLRQRMLSALQQGKGVTDEASAMEISNAKIKLVEGRSDNIKVTRPEDLSLATLFLTAQNKLI